MATETQIAELEAQGFTVENMGHEWGSDWEGQYRFYREEGDHIGVPQFTVMDAWDDLIQYQKDPNYSLD